MGRAILRAAEGSPTVTVRAKTLGGALARWRRRAPRISGRAALFFFSALALGVAGTIVVERRLPAPPSPPPPTQAEARSASDRSAQAKPVESEPVEKPFIPPRENRVFDKTTEPEGEGAMAGNRKTRRERGARVGAPVFEPTATSSAELEPPRRWQGFLTDSNCTEKGGQQGELHVRCAERCIREGAEPMLFSRGCLYKIEGYSDIEVSRGKPLDFKGWLDPRSRTITVAPD